MKSRQRWVRHHRSGQEVRFNPKRTHCQHLTWWKNSPKIRTVAWAVWQKCYSYGELLILETKMISWFGDAEDYAGRQSLEFLSGYRAQGHRAMLLEETGLQLHYGTEADALAVFPPQHRLHQKQYHLHSSPPKWERSSRIAFRSTLANTVGQLPSNKLWKSLHPHTSFLPLCCCYFFITSAKPGSLQILSAPSQQIRVTLDIIVLPFIATSTICSPNPFDCKDGDRMSSTAPGWQSQVTHAGSKLVSLCSQKGWSKPRTTLWTKGVPWAAKGMCQDPGTSIIDRSDITCREVELMVAPH